MALGADEAQAGQRQPAAACYLSAKGLREGRPALCWALLQFLIRRTPFFDKDLEMPLHAFQMEETPAFKRAHLLSLFHRELHRHVVLAPTS